MKYLRKVGIIRQRGQFTIPDAIRETVSWLNENGIVMVTLVTPTRLEIEPIERAKGMKAEGKKEADWDVIWKRIQEARSLKGTKRPKGGLSQFIIRDRQTRK